MALSNQLQGSLLYFLVPAVICDKAEFESTSNKGIMIYWYFIHTGGLNITSINITYTINDQTTIQYGLEVYVNDTTAFIPEVDINGTLAGYSYDIVVMVIATNSEGSTSVSCPPVFYPSKSIISYSSFY